MKKLSIILAIVVALFALPAMGSDKFPDLNLPNGGGKLSEFKSDFAFVEVYSMYCPICQRDAPRMNEIYNAISKKFGGEHIVFLGVGAGNTSFEVEFYRKKFNVEFPLYEDPDYVMHKALGGVGTPAFYLVDLREGRLDVLYSHIGEIENADEMLSSVIEIISK